MSFVQAARYVFLRKTFHDGGLWARLRALWHLGVLGYDSEICGHCGRPVRIVWRAPTAVWNYVMTGQEQTVYTVREGAAGGPVMERAEGVGGVLCIYCFDELARDLGIFLRWESLPL